MPTIETLGRRRWRSRSTGVTPRGAQVRRTGGVSETADSSRKHSQALRVWRLLDRRPVLDDPAGDHLLVALGSHPDGPHVPRVVAHPSKPPDHLGDAPKRPQFLVEAVPPGTLE